MDMKISDFIANFLVEKDVDLVFTITGAGNVRLIESVHNAGIDYVCTHHEQAAVMAALARTRITGKPAICLTTGGPGAANTLISVADAYLDSIPCIVIAGQEKLQYIDPPNALRGMGVQGLDMVTIMKSITKYSCCLTHPENIKKLLQDAFYHAFSGRPGPVWIEIPQDLQWATVNTDELCDQIYSNTLISSVPVMTGAAACTIEYLKDAKRPLLWVGHGIRLSNCQAAFRQLFDKLGVPALVSWQAADLVPDDHPLYIGRAGTYGQRWANFALQNCDLLITLGTRLALPQRGYVDSEFARSAKKVIVEIDEAELNKFTFPIDVPVLGDVGAFIDALLIQLSPNASAAEPMFQFEPWLEQCREWRNRYPMITSDENDTPNSKIGINSYRFIDCLSRQLTSNHIIVTDMGTSLTCTHATLRIKEGQRLLTSTGLGEMGFGLPGAIGAALGDSDASVVLIVGEGSLMMNLQELQTLEHLKLPIKIFLLNNNGYLSIKHTHHALFGSKGHAAATSPETGVSFPDFSKIAPAFGLDFLRITDYESLDSLIQNTLSMPRAVLCEIQMPEFQDLIPKQSLKLRSNGAIYSPPLEDLYPFLTAQQLADEMIIPLLESATEDH